MELGPFSQERMRGVERIIERGSPPMTDLNRKTQILDSAIIRFWRPTPVVIRTIIMGFMVLEIGVGAWLFIIMASLTVMDIPNFAC